MDNVRVSGAEERGGRDWAIPRLPVTRGRSPSVGALRFPAGTRTRLLRVVVAVCSAVAYCAGLGVPGLASADLIHWRGNGTGSGNWSDAGNWDNSGLPGEADTAVFGDVDTTVIDLDEAFTLGGLQFEPGAPAYTFHLQGSDLTLTGPGIHADAAPTLVMQPSPVNGAAILSFVGADTSAGNAHIIANGNSEVYFYRYTTLGQARLDVNDSAYVKFVDEHSKLSTAGDGEINVDGPGAYVWF